MSLKSSPGGQSLSFNTIGWPSPPCNRSREERRIGPQIKVISWLTGYGDS